MSETRRVYVRGTAMPGSASDALLDAGRTSRDNHVRAYQDYRGEWQPAPDRSSRVDGAEVCTVFVDLGDDGGR